MNAVLDLAGRRVTVIGLGKSGVAACAWLAAHGARVTGNDAKPEGEVSADVLALASKGVRLLLGGHGGLDDAVLVVVSPGVPPFPELEAASARGVPIWGEVELAVRAALSSAEAQGRPAPRVVAVGGTNGKSTTTSLVGALLEAKGLRPFVGGNLGEPLAAHADEPFDALVLEVSSFQMERVDALRPDVALLLNVTPDHLDRYPDFDAYAAAKGNAFARQTSSDLAVVPVNDAICAAQAKRGHAAVVTFGPGGDVDVTSEAVVDRASGATYRYDDIRLRGGHNALNVAAAVAAVRPFGLSRELVASVLARFEGLAHRMAFVGEREGVRYYDDSKGTNVGASVTAVRGVFEPKVVLIAGGRDKGGSYGPLADALRDKGRAVVVLGEASDLIAAAMDGIVPVRRATSMDEAVALAAALAKPGDAVLLSPACSSFDMFRDYKHRGDAFVLAFARLASERGDA